MRTIAFVQSKGGQAKTSTCFEFAYGLHKLGKKVLLVDLDPQANLSILCGANIDGDSVYQMLMEGSHPKAIAQAARYGDVIPANDDMSVFDYQLGAEVHKDREGDFFLLYDALKPVGDEYDVCLIDCPPNLNFGTMNGVVAADSIVIPTTADQLSLHGLGNLGRTIQQIKREFNPELSVDGILITRWIPRININRDMREGIEEIAKALETHVYETPIRENARIREAQFEGQAVQEFDQRANSAKDYASALAEFMKESE